VEQKNWTHVRKLLGWDRYDTLEARKAINDLYDQLRIFQNLFQPSMKLSNKTRKGSRVMRHYDPPCTPWQRVLKSSGKPGETIQALKASFKNIDPFQLSRHIDQQLEALYGLARQRNGLLREKAPTTPLPKLEFQQAKTSFATRGSAWRDWTFSKKLKHQQYEKQRQIRTQNSVRFSHDSTNPSSG
jgi:hypothetical protein